MRVLLDTNVLFDFFAKRKPYYEQTLQLEAMEMFGDVELWASVESFSDIFYVMRKEFSSEVIQGAFLEALDFVNVCSIGKSDIRAAASRSWPDFEDCLIDICAEKAKVACILTRDAKGFSRSALPSASPKQFFSWLEQERGLVYGTAPLSDATNQ